MGVEFKETSLPLPNKDTEKRFRNKKFVHICEVCDKRDILTPEEGHDKGWDYAPHMYPFKVISPRTCNKCGIEKTAWWQICVKGKSFEKLSDHHKDIVKRIFSEPESIIFKE